MGGGNLPFGFSPRDDEPEHSDDVTGKIPLFAELQKLLSWSGGPVNWDLARQMAISAIAGDYRPVSAAETADARRDTTRRPLVGCGDRSAERGALDGGLEPGRVDREDAAGVGCAVRSGRGSRGERHDIGASAGSRWPRPARSAT